MKFDLKLKSFSVFIFLVVLITWNFSAYSAPRCSRYLSKEKIPTAFLEEPLSAQPILKIIESYTFAEMEQAVKELYKKPDTLNIDSSSQRIFSKSFLSTRDTFIRFYSILVLSKTQFPREIVDRAFLEGLRIYSETDIQLIILVALAQRAALHLSPSEQIVLSDILLHSEHPLIKAHTATALGKVKSPIEDANKALIESLKTDSDKRVQLEVLTALGNRRTLNLGEVDQNRLNNILLYHESPFMRLHAAKALGRVQNPIEAVDRALLKSVVTGTNLTIKIHSAFSLAFSQKDTFNFNRDEQNFLIGVLSKNEDSLLQIYIITIAKKVESPTKDLREALTKATETFSM